MTDQQELCYRLLFALSKEEEFAARNRDYPLGALRNSLIARFPPVPSAALGRLIAPGVGTSIELAPRRKYIYWPADSKGGHFLPITTLRFDFAGTSPLLSLGLALFSGSPDKIRVAAYRFETPNEGGGVHGFFHAQALNGFSAGHHDLRADDDLVNDSQPSFPIDATHPVTLLLAAVMACYGATRTGELIRGRDFQRLPPFLDGLHWFQLANRTTPP